MRMSYFLPSNSTRTAVVRVCHVITGTQRRVSTHQATHTLISWSPSTKDRLSPRHSHPPHLVLLSYIPLYMCTYTCIFFICITYLDGHVGQVSDRACEHADRRATAAAVGELRLHTTSNIHIGNYMHNHIGNYTHNHIGNHIDDHIEAEGQSAMPLSLINDHIDSQPRPSP